MSTTHIGPTAGEIIAPALEALEATAATAGAYRLTIYGDGMVDISGSTDRLDAGEMSRGEAAALAAYITDHVGAKLETRVHYSHGAYRVEAIRPNWSEEPAGFDPARTAADTEAARQASNAAAEAWHAAPAGRKRAAAYRTYRKADDRYWLLVGILHSQGYGSDGAPMFEYVGDAEAGAAGTAEAGR
jgi:hypothetical protein